MMKKAAILFLLLFCIVACLGMDRLAETEQFNTYEEGEDLVEYLTDELTWIENLYGEIAMRVNWILSEEYDIEAHTADDTLTEGESGSLHTNLGATGVVTITLPASATKGIHFHFAVQAAQELRVDPGTATIRDDSGQTADKYKTANAIGENIELVADSNGDWVTVNKYGTWTEEP